VVYEFHLVPSDRLRKVATDAEATDLGRREEAHDDIDPVVVVIIVIVIVGIGVWILDMVANVEMGYGMST
jgi:hypothetical protein